MGSKNQIAPWVISYLPEAKHFYDLFAGGCAVTHAAMISGKYESFTANDLSPYGVTLFRDAIAGKYHDESRWISRAEFSRLKDCDAYVRLCWSFGNDAKSYMYAKEIESFKMRLHSLFFAETPYDRRLAWKAFVREFARLENDVQKLRVYITELFQECGIEMPRRSDGTPDTKTCIKLLNRHLTCEIREYMRAALRDSGLTQADIDRHLGNQMSGHYFGASQWALPTAEHYAKMQEIIPGLDKPWAELNESLQSLQSLQSLERLERLQSLESLQSLERLQSLESLEKPESLNVLTVDYREVEVLRDSVVYCDPPYRNTKQYSGMEGFSHEDFYSWLRNVEFPVWVSEYEMPDDFIRVASIRKRVTLSAQGCSKTATEGLFIHKRWKDYADRGQSTLLL